MEPVGHSISTHDVRHLVSSDSPQCLQLFRRNLTSSTVEPPRDSPTTGRCTWEQEVDPRLKKAMCLFNRASDWKRQQTEAWTLISESSRGPRCCRNEATCVVLCSFGCRRQALLECLLSGHNLRTTAEGIQGRLTVKVK